MHLRQLQSEWMREQPLSQEPNRSSALLSQGVPRRAGRRAGECWRAARRGGWVLRRGEASGAQAENQQPR
jgi:hypothetical protein